MAARPGTAVAARFGATMRRAQAGYNDGYIGSGLARIKDLNFFLNDIWTWWLGIKNKIVILYTEHIQSPD